MSSTVERVWRGAAAGAAATVAMSAVMMGAKRMGMVREPPPELIVEGTLDQAGVDADEEEENALATVTHLAYGVAAGALFALARPHLPGPAPWAGLGFGAALAVAGYQGWVPAAGLLPPLDEQSEGLRRTVVLSHLVYGASLDAAVARLGPE